MERNPWMCGQKHNIISILRKRHQVTSGAVQLCIRPRNGKRDIPCNYSGQNEPCRLHPYSLYAQKSQLAIQKFPSFYEVNQAIAC